MCYVMYISYTTYVIEHTLCYVIQHMLNVILNNMLCYMT